MKKIITTLLITLILTGCTVQAFDSSWGLESFTVKGWSMYPTLSNGQTVLVEVTKDIKVGDIVVIDNTNDFLTNNGCSTNKYGKRVVAVGGDIIESIDGAIYVNGEVYIEDASQFIGGYRKNYRIELKENEFFVIGDNFERSSDSRIWENKVVPIENIYGKVVKY